jgi:hypothetical protein
MDDILTSNEEQIRSLLTPSNAASVLSLPLADFTLNRRLGLNPRVTVNNNSGKKAWVILSPVPISSVE